MTLLLAVRGKHCHEKYVWPPVCLTTALHHGLVWSYRRQLEVCVFHYLALGLQSGDVYVEGSQAYADYRQQLMSWPECVSRLPAYCHALQMPESAASFVAHL